MLRPCAIFQCLLWALVGCAFPESRRAPTTPGSELGKTDIGGVLLWKMLDPLISPDDYEGPPGIHPALVIPEDARDEGGPRALDFVDPLGVGRIWSVPDLWQTILLPLEPSVCSDQCKRLYSTSQPPCSEWCELEIVHWQVVTTPRLLPAARGTYRLSMAPPLEEEQQVAERCNGEPDVLLALARRQRDDQGRVVIDRTGQELWTFWESFRLTDVSGVDSVGVPNAFVSVVVEPVSGIATALDPVVTLRLELPPREEPSNVPVGEILLEEVRVSDLALFPRPLPTPTDPGLTSPDPGEECSYILRTQFTCTAGAELPPGHYDDTVTGEEVSRYCFPLP